MEERVYTINIRKGTLTSPKWEKSNDSVVYVRNFLKKHMKTKEVKIDNSISEKIWEHGSKFPTGKIKIKARKEDDVVTAYLWGKEPLILEESKKKEAKKEELKTEEVKEGSVIEERKE